MSKTILLLGPPGVGKSTVTLLLKGAIKEKFMQFSVRCSVDRHIISGDDLGKRLKQHYYDNALLPDDLVEEVFADFLTFVSEDSILLIEGFPISEVQYTCMLRQLQAVRRTVDQVIVLTGERETLEWRVKNRLVCKKCENKNGTGLPVKIGESVCPYCKTKLTRRSDDMAGIFDRRYEMFINVYNVISSLINKEKLLSIDSSTFEVKQIADKIIECIA